MGSGPRRNRWDTFMWTIRPHGAVYSNGGVPGAKILEGTLAASVQMDPCPKLTRSFHAWIHGLAHCAGPEKHLAALAVQRNMHSIVSHHRSSVSGGQGRSFTPN